MTESDEKWNIIFISGTGREKEIWIEICMLEQKRFTSKFPFSFNFYW